MEMGNHCFGRFAVYKKLLSLLRFELRYLGCPVRGLVTIPTRSFRTQLFVAQFVLFFRHFLDVSEEIKIKSPFRQTVQQI